MAVKNLLKTIREKNLDEIGAELLQSTTKVVRDELNQEAKTALRQWLDVGNEAKKELHRAEKFTGDLILERR